MGKTYFPHRASFGSSLPSPISLPLPTPAPHDGSHKGKPHKLLKVWEGTLPTLFFPKGEIWDVSIILPFVIYGPP